MTAIGKGDWVEAVISINTKYSNIMIVAGQLYIVDDVVDLRPDFGLAYLCSRCGNRETGLLIGGIRHPCDSRPAWSAACPCLFKPIYRPKENFTRDLLNSTDLGGQPGIAPKELVTS